MEAMVVILGAPVFLVYICGQPLIFDVQNWWVSHDRWVWISIGNVVNFASTGDDLISNHHWPPYLLPLFHHHWIAGYDNAEDDCWSWSTYLLEVPMT